jgi:hypothetical protein
MMALLVLALGDWPGWTAQPEVSAVRVLVGQTVRVRVKAYQLYLSGGIEFRPLTFKSGNRRIIEVTGRMPVPETNYIQITGVRPGKAHALMVWADDSIRGAVEATVVCGKEPAIQTAQPHQTTKVGTPVMLRAETRIAERTTFTWYRGLVGDMSEPLAASGPELELTTSEPGLQHAWVMATTPCSSSTAQFAIDVVAPKRRSARH